MFTPKRIIIHHSLTRDSGTVSWSAIRKFHVEQCGWLDIGYHAGCERVGNVFECLYGRSVFTVGAHAKGNNFDSLGFCFVGNYDLQEPDPSMMASAIKRVLIPWMDQFEIPLSAIFPHSDFSDKTCPGSKFPFRDLLTFIQMARGQDGGTT